MHVLTCTALFSLPHKACQILTAKGILGIGLIFYFCRILTIYFPINSKLGPLMIRLQRMVRQYHIFLLQFAR